MTVAKTIGSSTRSYVPGTGISAGLWTTIVSSPSDHVELDVGRRRDQLEVELALEPLLHDVHVQQPEEPAAEPEPERLRGLGLVAERRVRQLQPVERLAELRVVAALVREQARPHHRLRLPVAGERLGRGVLARPA